MEFSIGSKIHADGDIYKVVGKIRYRNNSDGWYWDEYHIISEEYGVERWLSIDEHFAEYSISKIDPHAPISGYREVDRGTEEVIETLGDVGDVIVGDKAEFIEYEDLTEEYIISLEKWDDTVETSSGYYLDLNEFGPYNASSFVSRSTPSRTSKPRGGLGIFIMIIIALSGVFGYVSEAFGGNGGIAKYLKANPEAYTYETSITGNEKQRAQVYRSSFTTIDATVKDIIDGVEGLTQDVTQNQEDGDTSVVLLTNKEYCLVYTAEDNKTVFVQISNRKYAYTSDKTLYRGRNATRRFYRRYYYSRAYTTDSQRYKNSTSAYSSFDDTALATGSASSEYNNYSNTIRQQSVSSRSSSGGGLSSGK